MPPPSTMHIGALKQLISRAVVTAERPLINALSFRPQISTSRRLDHGSRPFSQTAYLYRGEKGSSDKNDMKKKKPKVKASAPPSAPKQKSAQEQSELSEVDAALASMSNTFQDIHLKLGTKLDGLKTGGRFNPQILEDLRVQLQKIDKQTYRLGDLAQIIPKGRQLLIVAGDKDHVKAILSAIQSSEILQVQPQASADNPQEMTITIPPPTKESRALAAEAVLKEAQVAKADIEKARAVMNKRIRALKLNSTLTSDEATKASKDMENECRNAFAVSKGMVDPVRKEMG